MGGAGLRTPIGNRIAHAALARVGWGGGRCILIIHVANLPPWAIAPILLQSHTHHFPLMEKYETRGEQPRTIDTYERPSKQHDELFCLFHGEEGMPERLEVIEVFHRIHGEHPDVTPPHCLIMCRVAKTYRYVSDLMGGVRLRTRMLPDNVRKTEYRRNALTPGPAGRPRWGFPNDGLMGRQTGYWQAISIPQMVEGISKSSRNSALRGQPKPLGIRAMGWTSRRQRSKSLLRRTRRGRRYDRMRSWQLKAIAPDQSKVGRACSGIFRHTGRQSPEPSCARGKHEVINMRGLHPRIKMHMARRGGHRSEKRISQADVDGLIQSLRNTLKADATQHAETPEGHRKYKLNDIGPNGCATNAATAPPFVGPHPG